MARWIVAWGLVLAAGCETRGPVDPGWATLRGPDLNGTYPGRGRFRLGVDFEPAWTKDGGPGYSAITAENGTIVTELSDGAQNVLVALDPGSGRERWRVAIGPMRQGQGGAADGPLSTPVIHDGLVYALDPAGSLVAVSLRDGTRAWSMDLAADHGAVPPPHGFATTPLVLDDVLVVQAGAPGGRSTVGLDPHSGTRLWSHGNDEVGYQSPIGMTIAGKRQVLALTHRTLYGLDPTAGTELWRLPLVREATDGIVHVSPAGPDRLLIQYTAGALLYERNATGTDLSWVELWRTTELAQSLAPALWRDGHLYGFRQGALICLDASTGRVVWASEGLGARGMLLVDDTLLVLTTGGTVIAVRASPEGFEERARIATSLRDSYTWPSFDGERLYVRDLEHIAAVKVVARVRGE